MSSSESTRDDRVRYHSYDNLVELIDAHEDLLYKHDATGKTLLHLHAHDRRCTEFLLSKKADPNARNEYGQTPLFFSENSAITRLLVEHKADVNARNAYGQTPLFWVDDNVSPSPDDIIASIKILVEYKADVNARDNYGSAPIFMTYKYEVLKCLLEYGADPNVTDYSSKTVLSRNIWVAEPNSKLLLDYKADPNAWRDCDENTLLHIAASVGKWPTVQLLVEYKADVNALDEMGRTPIFDTDSCVVLEYLLQNGADPNVLDNDGNSILTYRVWKLNKLEILLKYGANPNHFCDAYPLDLYKTSGMKLLLEYKADPNKSNLFKQPLDDIMLLLSHGADPYVENDNGHTLLHSLLNGDRWILPGNDKKVSHDIEVFLNGILK